MTTVLKYISITLLLIILWVGSIYYATDNGWLHSPITTQQNSEEFVFSVHKEIKKEFAGTMAMALFENGKLVKESFYDKNEKVNRNTIFQVASLSKLVSALGVMRLVQEGKIELDKPVNIYLKRWKLPSSTFDNNEVTVRRLLSHTGGLTDGLGYSGFTNETDLQTLEESLNRAKDADFGKDGQIQIGVLPGSEWRYSGGGFTLLQLLIEEVSNTSFDNYMRAEIFKPLSMHSSFFEWNESYKDRLCDFYHENGTLSQHRYYTAQAASGLYTTLADLEKLFYFFDGGDGGQSPLSTELLRSMWQAEAKSLGANIYGLGTFLYTEIENGEYIIGHDGKNNPPINSAFRYNPITNSGIVILTTGSNDFATRIACDWVFVKTGKIDALLFLMQLDKMMQIMVFGSIVILALMLLIVLLKRNPQRLKLIKR